MIFYLILFSFISWANPNMNWTNAVEIVDKHEFYQNHQMIDQPKNSWQTLFAVVYRSSSFELLKDCVYYLVPGNEKGVLKIKTLKMDQQCKDYIFTPADQEWGNVKAMQFALLPERIIIGMTFHNYKSEKWDIPFVNNFSRPQPKLHMSSAELRSPKMIFLTPKKTGPIIIPKPKIHLEDSQLCHGIDDQCQELFKSKCGQCSQGWYEIPNGCPVGPKYCGNQICGKKNLPACRRGMVWQRRESNYSCREDDSFAYCARGLKIQCQGNLPYCI